MFDTGDRIMSASETVTINISSISVIVAVAALLYTWVSNRPAISGHVNYVLLSPLQTSTDAEGSATTAIMLHITLTRYLVVLPEEGR